MSVVLPAPVGPDDRDALPGLGLEGDVLERAGGRSCRRSDTSSNSIAPRARPMSIASGSSWTSGFAFQEA